MAENGQSTSSSEPLGEDEILVISSGGTQGTSTTGTVRLATSIEPDPNEIPDPPPEKD